MRKIIYDDYFEVALSGEYERAFPNIREGEVKLPVHITKSSGCYVEILERLAGEMLAMLCNHNKLFTMRFDLRLDEYLGNNKQVTDFMRPLRKWLKREYNTSEVGYIWIREQETAKKQHYHFVLLLDGNKAKSSKSIFDRIQHIASYLDISAWLPKKPFNKIIRGDLDGFSKAFKRGSYLAKERGKGYKDKTANNYSASEIAIRPKTLAEELAFFKLTPPNDAVKVRPKARRKAMRQKASNQAIQFDMFIAE